MGKKTVLGALAIIALGVAFFFANGHINAIYILAGLIVVVLFGTFFSIDKTLDRHPQLALMDGAEIIKYRQIEMAAKNMPSLPETPHVTDPNPPPQMLAAPYSNENED